MTDIIPYARGGAIATMLGGLASTLGERAYNALIERIQERLRNYTHVTYQDLAQLS